MRKVLYSALLVLFSILLVSCGESVSSEELAPVGTVSTPEPLTITNDYYYQDESAELINKMQMEEDISGGALDADAEAGEGFDYATDESGLANMDVYDTEQSASSAKSLSDVKSTDDDSGGAYANWNTIDFKTMGLSNVSQPSGMDLTYLYGTNGSFVDWNVSFSNVSERDFRDFAQRLYAAGVKYSKQTWSEDGQTFKLHPASSAAEMISSKEGKGTEFYGFSQNNGGVGTFDALWDSENETMEFAIWYVP